MLFEFLDFLFHFDDEFVFIAGAPDLAEIFFHLCSTSILAKAAPAQFGKLLAGVLAVALASWLSKDLAYEMEQSRKMALAASG